jgi:hypothetical protein
MVRIAVPVSALALFCCLTIADAQTVYKGECKESVKDGTSACPLFRRFTFAISVGACFVPTNHVAPPILSFTTPEHALPPVSRV